jgi:hypothetical protein
VIRRQLAEDTGAISWHRVDAARTPDSVLREIGGRLREQLILTTD